MVGFRKHSIVEQEHARRPGSLPIPTRGIRSRTGFTPPAGHGRDLVFGREVTEGEKHRHQHRHGEGEGHGVRKGQEGELAQDRPGKSLPIKWSSLWAMVLRKRRPVMRVKEKRNGPMWLRIR